MADRSITVRLRAETDSYIRSLRAASLATDRFASHIERTTGRSAKSVASHGSAFRAAGEQLGDSVSKGYRKGVQGVTKETERVAKRANLQFSALAATIATSLPAASAAAIGAATAGASVAFIGLAGVALKENAKIKASFQGLGETVKTDLAADASVLESAFVGSARRMGSAFQELRPQLRRAFEESVPHVERVTESVVDLAQNAMPGLVASVDRAGPVFKGLHSLMADTGTAISDFFLNISEHSEQAGEGFEHLGNLIQGVLPGIGNILGDLTNLWAEHGDEAVDAINRVVGTLSGLTNTALPVLGEALGTALGLFNDVLGVLEPISGLLGFVAGGWLSVALAMKTMRGVSGIIDRVGDSFGRFDEKAGSARRTAVIAGGAITGLALAGEGLQAAFGKDLSVNMEAFTLGLERWAEQGRLSGEAARFLGQNAEGLSDSFEQLGSWTEPLARFAQGLVGTFSSFKGSVRESEEQVGKLGDALGQLVEDGKADVAAEVFGRVAEQASQFGISADELLELMPGYTSALEIAGEATGGTSEATGRLNEQLAGAKTKLDEARTALEAYMEQQLLATDPVFRLREALVGVDQAQRAYNEAVRIYGAQSPEAMQASWDLAAAVSGAEQAALNGDLSFEAFKGKLRQWVAQGVITQGQADRLAGRVENLRGRAEDYRGDYGAQLHADTQAASSAVAGLQGQLNALEGTYTSYHTLVKSVITQGGQGTSGLNNFNWKKDGGLIRGYADGGLPGYPMGGLFRGIGGPRDDANIVALSDGEYVVNAASTARWLPLLETLNSNRFADGGPVGMANGGLANGGMARRSDFSLTPFVKLGDVTEEEWRALLRHGWQGRAGDDMEALYPPLGKVRRGFVRLGEVTHKEWEALLSAGWRGKAGDKMEALYPPLDRLRNAINGAAAGFRQAAPRPLSPKQRAAAELIQHIQSGGRVFEDFSFRGASANVSRFNDQFASQFYRSGRGFSASAMLRFLRGFHDGGAVYGTGPAVVHDDEHVWTSREVQAAGGHANVAALRQSVLSSAVRGAPTVTTVVQNNTITVSGAGNPAQIVHTIRKEIKNFGGDVQRALGGR